MTCIVFNSKGERKIVGIAPKRQYIFTLITHEGKKTTKTHTATSKKYGKVDYDAEINGFGYEASGEYASVNMILREWRDADDPYFDR